MDAHSDDPAARTTAMAGGRSPWGGDKHESGQEPAGGDATEGEAPQGDAPGEPPASPPPPSGPRNPWAPAGETPPRRSAGIEDIFRPRGKGPRPGGSGGPGGPGGFVPKFPRRADGRSWGPMIAGSVAVLWLLVTTTHQLGSTEQGIVTTFGKYSRTIGSGVSMTAPWPIQSVDVEDVTSIKRDTIPDGEEEKLMLTSDQGLVDLSYLVRWNIRNLKLYKFQLNDPDNTVKEVAEAAMRASVAEVSLRDVMSGTGRGMIEQNVRQRMQAVLDAYRSGVLIQGVDIKKANPPAKVNEAFQQVSAAQQEAQQLKSRAQGYAQQIIAKAQGDTAEFDQVYTQYKVAPEVTRRRMYYETMEGVLSNNDKVVVEGSNVTPYLPLPELRRRAPDDSASAAPQGGQ